MSQEMHVTIADVSVNCLLVGVLRKEPSAVEHGLPLLVVLLVLLAVALLGHHAVLEEQPLQAVSAVQDC
jgi:hypothetical protein